MAIPTIVALAGQTVCGIVFYQLGKYFHPTTILETLNRYAGIAESLIDSNFKENALSIINTLKENYQECLHDSIDTADAAFVKNIQFIENLIDQANRGVVKTANQIRQDGQQWLNSIPAVGNTIQVTKTSPSYAVVGRGDIVFEVDGNFLGCDVEKVGCYLPQYKVSLHKVKALTQELGFQIPGKILADIDQLGTGTYPRQLEVEIIFPVKGWIFNGERKFRSHINIYPSSAGKVEFSWDELTTQTTPVVTSGNVLERAKKGKKATKSFTYSAPAGAEIVPGSSKVKRSTRCSKGSLKVIEKKNEVVVEAENPCTGHPLAFQIHTRIKQKVAKAAAARTVEVTWGEKIVRSLPTGADLKVAFTDCNGKTTRLQGAFTDHHSVKIIKAGTSVEVEIKNPPS